MGMQHCSFFSAHPNALFKWNKLLLFSNPTLNPQQIQWKYTNASNRNASYRWYPGVSSFCIWRLQHCKLNQFVVSISFFFLRVCPYFMNEMVLFTLPLFCTKKNVLMPAFATFLFDSSMLLQWNSRVNITRGWHNSLLYKYNNLRIVHTMTNQFEAI